MGSPSGTGRGVVCSGPVRADHGPRGRRQSAVRRPRHHAGPGRPRTDPVGFVPRCCGGVARRCRRGSWPRQTRAARQGAQVERRDEVAVGRAVDREDGHGPRLRVVRRGGVERRHVAVLRGLVRGAPARPAARRRGPVPAAWAKGWKMVCRQAGPPGSVRIGAITLTSWARQAMPTRSACRSRVISRLPTTTASATV